MWRDIYVSEQQLVIPSSNSLVQKTAGHSPVTYGGRRGRKITGVGGSGRRRSERVLGNHQDGCLEEEKQEVWGEKKGGKRGVEMKEPEEEGRVKEKGNNNNNHNTQDKREGKKESRKQSTILAAPGFSSDQVQPHLLLRKPSSASELEGIASVTVLKTL